jgi:hypothetical protein
MLRHDYVSQDYEPIAATDTFEDFQEEVAARGITE